MTEQADRTLAHVELMPAERAQEPILANLLELYIHDFSEFHDIEIGSDGRFGYPHLSHYWSEPDRYPFLVSVDGKLAGLVLVKPGEGASGLETTWDIGEFFILRGYRRRGIGTAAAQEVWRRFPGRWEVRVMQSNVSALDFWARAIATFTGETKAPVAFEKSGTPWLLFCFESK